MLWSLRARLGYLLARRLLGWPWLVKQPRAWQWMQGQFSRMAALGDVAAQSFYGHLLLFRGQGLGAREEGMRLLRLALGLQPQLQAQFAAGHQPQHQATGLQAAQQRTGQHQGQVSVDGRGCLSSYRHQYIGLWRQTGRQ